MDDWHGWMVIIGRHGGLAWMDGDCRKAWMNGDCRKAWRNGDCRKA